MPLQRLILTSGEPAGIGPDLCLQVIQRDWPCELVVAADPGLLRQRAASLGLTFSMEIYDALRPARAHRAGRLLTAEEALAAPVEPGRLDPANSAYVLRLLDRAALGCQRGEFQAMVTAPVQKSVIADAGVPFSGHTEYLAERTGASLPVMMLAAGDLRVALATTHLPLSAVGAALSTEKLLAILEVIDTDLRTRYGLERPRIRVCGLNPHAGESGHLGREDIEIIAPAIERARQAGIDASGPAPADTAFTPRSLVESDLVLTMYHDQGLPVIKYAGFGHAVNVTLGLPIIRTSVDHGTALTLAGTGQADPGSMMAAIEHAIALAGRARA